MVPLKKSFPVFEAIIEVNKAVTGGSNEVKLSNDDFPDSEVEGRPCIKEQAEDRLFVVFDRVMDGLRRSAPSS